MTKHKLIQQGAEAKIWLSDNTIIKDRIAKLNPKLAQALGGIGFEVDEPNIKPKVTMDAEAIDALKSAAKGAGVSMENIAFDQGVVSNPEQLMVVFEQIVAVMEKQIAEKDKPKTEPKPADDSKKDLDSKEESANNPTHEKEVAQAVARDVSRSADLRRAPGQGNVRPHRLSRR